MKERSEQESQTGRAAGGRRKRVAEGVVYIVYLLVTPFLLLLLVLALRTGYLSWIGVTFATVFVASIVASPILHWAGRKRLVVLCTAVHLGMMTLAAVLVGATFLWPQDSSNWRPYRFDDELAAIEARRAVPEAENAAPRYEAVFRQTDENDDPNCLFITASSLRSEFEKQPWKGDDHPQASAWLDSRSQAIDGLLEIGRMEKCRWPVQADGSDKYTVPYKNLRHCTLLLIAAANRDLGDGRIADTLTKCFCTLRIADHIHQQPSMVDVMTSFGCERSGLQMIRRLLVQNDLSDKDIAQIAAHLPPAADPWPQEWERLKEHEKLHYVNSLGPIYEINAEGKTRFSTNPLISPKGGKESGGFPRFYWLMTMPRNPQGVRGLVDKYFAGFERRVNDANLPPMDPDKRFAHLSLADYMKARCNPLRFVAEMFFFNEHAYVGHRHHRLPALMQRRGTWLVLGLRRYREAHGVWPLTLDAVSEYVPPEAFFDPTARATFVYTLDGDNFKLYSKGPNRIDEGGRHGYVRALDKSEDDISVWPPPAPEPRDDGPMDEEMMKQLEIAYGKGYVETYMKNKGSDKR